MWITDFIGAVSISCGGTVAVKTFDTVVPLNGAVLDTELWFPVDPDSTYVATAYLGTSKNQVGTTNAAFRFTRPSGAVVFSQFGFRLDTQVPREGNFVTSATTLLGNWQDIRLKGLQSPTVYAYGPGDTDTTVHVHMETLLIRTGATGGVVVVEWAHSGTGGTIIGKTDSHIFYKKI